MPDSSFLNGKVLKRSLPELHLPLGPDAPVLKRLMLPQGELAQFYDAEEGIRYLAFIELRPGAGPRQSLPQGQRRTGLRDSVRGLAQRGRH
jgi:hypothetical protein